jgi:hypothetical protein
MFLMKFSIASERSSPWWPAAKCHISSQKKRTHLKHFSKSTLSKQAIIIMVTSDIKIPRYPLNKEDFPGYHAITGLGLLFEESIKIDKRKQPQRKYRVDINNWQWWLQVI